jgi:hypothetical protein
MRGYIKLQMKSKKPSERWRENQYAREELTDWVNAGYNIGFATGTDDVVVLDIDNPSRIEELGIKPYETYAVRTGSGGFHLYYKVKNAKKVVLFDVEGNHLGELQALGQYVVVPPSVHPNGSPYRVINRDTPITELTQDELLAPFLGKTRVTREIKLTPKFVSGNKDDPLSGVSVGDVWDAKVTESHGGQLFCEHPVHNSSTGRNLVIHPGKNTWACMRCRSGGGVAMAIAVKYGIIQCYEARPGALRGDRFKEVLALAKEKGFIYEKRDLLRYVKKEVEIDDDGEVSRPRDARSIVSLRRRD